MSNSEFDKNALPNFSAIDICQIEPTISNLLTKNKTKINELLAQSGPFTWDNLMQPMEDMNDELSKIWGPIGHMHAVMQTEELREAYNNTLPKLTEYNTEISQNEKLFQATSAIAQSAEFKNLNKAQQKIIENDIRDFKLSGIHLPPDKKARMSELKKKLSQLTTKFAENILDATQGWFLHITDEKLLENLPPHALQLAIDNAKQRDLEGYVFTLDQPSYSTAIKFLSDRELRKTLYEAHTTRASDAGPNAFKWDNGPIMDEIVQAREELAELVGFKNFAQYSLAPKMAKTTDEVLGFLNGLVEKSKPIAKEEFQEIIDFAKKLDGIENLEAWDIAYYSEKLQKQKFDFTQEDFRPYFPINKVLNGLFTIVNKIYGITVREQTNVDVWHPHVKFFCIYDEQNNLRGGFYTDLFARPNKRDGAWMDECRCRRKTNGEIQLPVAFLTCNFMPPVDNQPALLTHDDVLTIFHEFGHCLHHLLTKVNYPSVGGINGVPWDAVEFPSQFMENFCWEKESLNLIAQHYQTGAPLPDDLYKNMIAAKNFHTGLMMIRQIEFSLFDFQLHIEYDIQKAAQKPSQVQSVLNEVRDKVAVIQPPVFNRFQNSFSHIFAGGYAAGYYSYKWAEVLSADAYFKFKENGVFNRAIGKSFMENILEVGGVRDPMDSFIAFRGRPPSIDALLIDNGIIPTNKQ